MEATPATGGGRRTAGQLAAATVDQGGFPLSAVGVLPPDEQLRFWFWVAAWVRYACPCVRHGGTRRGRPS